MQTVIIDVRTPKEFRDGALPGAINLPSGQFTEAAFAPYRNHHICLVCESGNRAVSIKGRLEDLGFAQVSLLEKQMEDLAAPRAMQHGWSIDRQFRLALAILLGIFLLGYYIQLDALLIVPIIVFSGLLFSAITNNCYLKELIAWLPWNRKVA